MERRTIRQEGVGRKTEAGQQRGPEGLPAGNSVQVLVPGGTPPDGHDLQHTLDVTDAHSTGGGNKQASLTCVHSRDPLNLSKPAVGMMQPQKSHGQEGAGHICRVN